MRESHEHNNTRVGRAIMVVAQRWKVVQFQTVIKNTAIGSQEFTAAGSSSSTFYFRLSRFNETKELFEYKPSGLLRAGYDETGTCTAHGGDSKTNDPWPGQLWLNDNLDGYSALIDASALPEEMAPLYCNNVLVGQQTSSGSCASRRRPRTTGACSRCWRSCALRRREASRRS